MRKILLRKRYLFILLFPVGLLLNSLAAANSAVTEKLYSGPVYRAISQTVSGITGKLPFSLAEILVILLTLFILWRLAALLRMLFSKRRDKLASFTGTILNAVLIFSVIYFCFIAMWGLNYSRLSLPRILGIEIKPASVKELEGLSASLIDRANVLRGRVAEDSEGVMKSPGGFPGVLKRAPEGYKASVYDYPMFGGTYGYPKPVMLSGLMSYTSIWGVYFPYTSEPNVNIDIPAPVLPSTVSHEMAHQRGFAREDEANYISYLVCGRHPDADFQYSGVLLGLTYTLNSLYANDSEAYNRQKSRLSAGVRRDLQAVSRFDQQHKSPLQDFSSKVNDLYLKANNQKEGEKTYGMVVDLLLAEYRSGK